MPNELLFLASALLDISFVFVAARIGPEWLFGAIAANLIMIGIFGAKLVAFFGFVTNAGNIFYACVFLATYFLLERGGEGVAWKTIFFGSSFVLFFAGMSQLAVQFSGVATSAVANDAIATLFMFSPRIIVGSVIAYMFAQYVNIAIYKWLARQTHGRYLWLRSNAANAASQLVDSSLFFTIAFFDLPGALLVQTILIGWAAKILVVSMGTPVLYLDAYLRAKKV